MNTKDFFLREYKATDEGNGTISGYFSVFGNVDRSNEIVVKGAFQNTIPQFLKSGFIASNHEFSSIPIAMPLQAFEDEIGLFVTAEFHSTPKAQEMRRTVQERVAKGLEVKTSIGYQVNDAEYNTEGVRLLKDLELFECSIVNTPANPRAALTSVKSLLANDMTLEEQHEMTLAVIDHYARRMKEYKALKTKDGRAISKRTRERLLSVLEALDSLETPKAILRELVAERDAIEAELLAQQAAREDALKAKQTALNKLKAASLTATLLLS
jgi:HK97 family phage prohead protease